MALFSVKIFESGVWDKIEPRTIEADGAQQAAETVCGGSLRDAGKLGQLRAEVWEPAMPGGKWYFYEAD